MPLNESLTPIALISWVCVQCRAWCRDFTVNVVSEWMIDVVTKIAGSYEQFTPDKEADLAASGITTSPSEQVHADLRPSGTV